MSVETKKVNTFFRTALKSEVDKTQDELILSDFETEVFNLKYRNKMNGLEIAKTLGVSRRKVDKTLYTIRRMIYKLDIIKSPNVKFDVATSSEREIRDRCLLLGKSDEYADFCVLAFRSGLTRKEIAERLHLSEHTVKKYKRDRKRELEAL